MDPNTRITRRQALGASAIGATGLLTGLAWRGETQPVAARAQDATTVTLESWSPIQQTTDKMIAAFSAANPDITIERTILNYPDYILDVRTRAASDSLPGIIGLEPGALTQEYRQFLIPLNDLAVETWGDDWQDNFFPIGLDQARLGNPSGDESFYGLPVLTQTINLWYTLPIFAEAGLEPPTTYDEMLAVAEALNGMGVAPLLHGAADGWQRRDIYMQLAHNLAPGLIYEAEVGDAQFTDPALVEALTWYKRLFDDGIVQAGALGLSAYPNSAGMILAGQAGMFPMGAWWQQEAANEDPPELAQGLQGYAPFRFPDISGSGAPPDDLLGGIDVMFGITTAAEDPAAAFTVLADFISGAGGQALIDTFNDLPAVSGLDPQTFASDHQQQVWTAFTEEWLPNVKYARQLRDAAVKQALEDALAGVASGEVTPEDGMAAVQAAWTAPA
ncbi:MAG: extracellular solute-binding protein [Chloroflexota bacterium]|nr:extracellular solute-binding protein [Chloroflexia bacterium]MDQ3225099.1 extracellular solute-binding protein [Chloroflexota bacterium]